MAEPTDLTEYMLTTVDNPFNPFTRFGEWFTYDRMLGYDTPSLLDRIAQYSEEISDPDQRIALNNAIDEIVTENASGMHRKVSKVSAVELGLL
jgi:hypothetical protein